MKICLLLLISYMLGGFDPTPPVQPTIQLPAAPPLNVHIDMTHTATSSSLIHAPGSGLSSTFPIPQNAQPAKIYLNSSVSQTADASAEPEITAVKWNSQSTVIIRKCSSQAVNLTTRLTSGAYSISVTSIDGSGAAATTSFSRLQCRVLPFGGTIQLHLMCEDTILIHFVNYSGVAVSAYQKAIKGLIRLKDSDRDVSIALNGSRCWRDILHLNRSGLTNLHKISEQIRWILLCAGQDQSVCRNIALYHQHAAHSAELVNNDITQLEIAMAHIVASMYSLTPQVAMSSDRKEIKVSLTNSGAYTVYSVKLRMPPYNGDVFPALKPGQTVSATFPMSQDTVAPTGEISFLTAGTPAEMTLGSSPFSALTETPLNNPVH